MMNIPFYKPSIGEDEIAEVVDTLRSGWLTTGPKVKQFEREFALYLGHKHAVAVNSCTAALHLALEAIGLKAGQGVVVPTMTFAATAEVVRYLGARPILADCRTEDFNLDVVDAERRIQDARRQGIEVKAIVPMHYGGQIGDVAGVAALARRHKLKIIEDAAHCCPAFYKDRDETGNLKPESRKQPSKAESSPVKCREDFTGQGKQPGEMKGRFHGPEKAEMGNHSQPSTIHHQLTVNSQLSTINYATNGWKPVGTGADISCYSFYANKTITTGEGGMACTANDEYADRMRIMSLHGISRDAWKRYTGEGTWFYEIIAPGFKYNLTDIAAAIGLHQVRKANAFHARRTELARLYTQALREVEEVIVPRVQPNRIHSWHLYCIRLRVDRLRIDRAQFITELKQLGIATSVHWLPLHMHPYYRETYGYRPEDFPIAAALYPQLVTLPLYPDMSEEDVRRVGEGIKKIVKAQGKSRK
jgi:dTDP-4-amino-4,6-dideoxygalactose transaminase